LRNTTYPIWDSRVDRALWLYRKQYDFKDFSRHDLRNYPKFVEIVDAFRATFHLVQFDYKAIDKFLYMLDTGS